MSHPVIPQVLELAAPIAESLGLAVVTAVFRTNQNPPVLRVDIRNLMGDTGLTDCERMSRALDEALDAAALLPDAYVLEISSPGVSRVLETDRDFISFKGFPVLVSATTAIDGKTEWSGNLLGRDATTVKVSLKGRTVAIPLDRVAQVQLEDHPE